MMSVDLMRLLHANSEPVEDHTADMVTIGLL